MDNVIGLNQWVHMAFSCHKVCFGLLQLKWRAMLHLMIQEKTILPFSLWDALLWSLNCYNHSDTTKEANTRKKADLRKSKLELKLSSSCVINLPQNSVKWAKILLVIKFLCDAFDIACDEIKDAIKRKLEYTKNMGE